MKRNYFLPFAATALAAALSGCGGESANVIPEVYDTSTANGACTIGTSGCLGFALDYPLDGLNFTCSSDTVNVFTTNLNLTDGAATGACKIGDTATFFIKGEKDKRINLGSLDLNSIAKVSVAQLPRLSIADIAAGLTGSSAASLNENDATIKVAVRIVRILQALALQERKISNPADIQALYITDSMRTQLENIAASIPQDKLINTTDAEFEALINPWINLSSVTNAQAFEAVKTLVMITNGAVYQPEFSLFSTAAILGSALSGSDGLVGCNKDSCDTTDASTQHIFGHFMVITDREGYTFGSGLQWQGSGISGTQTVGGLNTKLITSTRPIRLTAPSQNTWLNPLTKKIDQNYNFNVGNSSSPLTIYQGKLYNDYMIAGKEKFYKLLTGKTTVSSADQLDFGLWKQTAGADQFKGTLDLYKTFPITYLDKAVFKSAANVSNGESYVFPMYADLTFKFTDTSVSNVKLGIVIEENGNIRSNIKSGFTADDMSTGTCDSSTFNKATYIQDGVQQYRLGAVSRAFTNDKTVSLRMVLGGVTLGKIDGALIGMNSSIKTDSDGNSLVIGGALLNVGNLLGLTGGTASIPFTDSTKTGDVKWANSLASFQRTYNTNNTTAVTAQDTELAKLAGGTLSISLAPCYSVKVKN